MLRDEKPIIQVEKGIRLDRVVCVRSPQAVPMIPTVPQLDEWLSAFSDANMRVRDAVANVLYHSLGDPIRPADMGREFNLGRTMASRLHRASMSDDPNEVSQLLPGRPTMLRFVERAESICRKAKAVSELRVAYEELLEQIQQVASSQQELSALLSVHDPKLMRETADRQRAAFFRAATDMYGGSADVVSYTWIALPDEHDPKSGHWAMASAYQGLRRLGVMKPVALSVENSESVEGAKNTTTHLDGTEINYNKDGVVIRELSSPNLPECRTVCVGKIVHSFYISDDLPQGEPVDMVRGSVQRGGLINSFPGEAGSDRVGSAASIPSKLHIVDILVHKDIWEGIDPVLKLYDLPTLAIPASPSEYWFFEAPNFDELKAISMEQLLRPLADAPRHSVVTSYAIEQTGINIEDYRAYRIMIRFPVVGRQVWVYFSRTE